MNNYNQNNQNSIHGSNNTIIQFQSNDSIQNPILDYSKQYSAKDYCYRKHTFGSLIRILITIIATIADLLTITQVFFPLLLKSFYFLNTNKQYLYLILSFVFALVAIALTALIKYELVILSNIHTSGICHNIYYSDTTYKLITNRCPICGSRVTIKSSKGTITFHCTKSDNHSKTIDITELNNLPMK